MSAGGRARRLAGAALLVAAGAGGWELQRRADARRVAADPESAELSRRIAGREVEVRSADGTRIHAEVFGPDGAPTIVLAHGWTCSLDFWHYQIRDLAGEFRVVAYDQRGHGRSAQPARSGFTSDALGDDLDAVLEACLAPGARCVVAGHSMGGMTIVAWAGRHPEAVRRRVAGAALVDTGMGDLASDVRIVTARGLSGIGRRLSPHAVGAAVPLPRRSTPVFRRVVHYVTMARDAAPARVAFCEAMILGCPAPVRGGFGGMFAGIDLYDDIPHLDVPTVVIVGDADRLTPPVHARRLMERLPDARELVELRGIGHMAPVEAPEVVTARIRALAVAQLSPAPSVAPADPATPLPV